MTGGVARTPIQPMLRAIGFENEDFRKPIVGLASTGAEVCPCNVHHDELAAVAKQALKGFGCAPLNSNTFFVTDGRFSGGSHGMVAGHVAPEAQEGETIANLRDGDRITIDSRS
jgi:dihydroxy-acid dehydratase